MEGQSPLLLLPFPSHFLLLPFYFSSIFQIFFYHLFWISPGAPPPPMSHDFRHLSRSLPSHLPALFLPVNLWLGFAPYFFILVAKCHRLSSIPPLALNFPHGPQMPTPNTPAQ